MVSGAGTVLWKFVEDEIYVCLVARAQYSDWSLPKGKIAHNESAISCAYRETKEETGFDLRIGKFLGIVTYSLADEEKTIAYWAAEALKNVHPIDSHEITEIEWMPISAALSRVHYQSDKSILLRFNEIEHETNTLILLRHAKALDRNDWVRSDIDRPLSDLGLQQSTRLAKDLGTFGVMEIFSSPAERCISTVQPYGRAKKSSINVEWSLMEDVNSEQKAIKFVKSIMKLSSNYLICSHNPLLPKIMRFLIDESGVEITETHLNPADAWIIHHILGDVVGIDILKFSN